MIGEQLFAEMRRMAAEVGPPNAWIGRVKSVDRDTATCTVAVQGEPDYERVRLSCIELASNQLGLLVVPAVGAQACVCRLGERGENYYVLHPEAVEELVVRGGGHGGVLIADKVTERLNKLEQALRELQTTFRTHVHPYVAPPSPTVLYTTPITPTPSLTDPGATQSIDLQNPYFKHG